MRQAWNFTLIDLTVNQDNDWCTRVLCVETGRNIDTATVTMLNSECALRSPTTPSTSLNHYPFHYFTSSRRGWFTYPAGRRVPRGPSDEWTAQGGVNSGVVRHIGIAMRLRGTQLTALHLGDGCRGPRQSAFVRESVNSG